MAPVLAKANAHAVVTALDLYRDGLAKRRVAPVPRLLRQGGPHPRRTDDSARAPRAPRKREPGPRLDGGEGPRGTSERPLSQSGSAPNAMVGRAYVPLDAPADMNPS